MSIYDRDEIEKRLGADLDLLEQRLGLTRRDFLTFCSGMAATLGLSMGGDIKIAQALANPARRPTVIWLSGSECTGCTESLLRSTHPALDKLILDIISLDYSETLSTPAGHNVEAVRKQSMKENKGKYVLVVEGAIAMKDGGIYCKVGGVPFVKSVQEAAADAAAVIAIGSCASWGGMPSADPNPTECVGVPKVVTDKPVVTIPGCPPNPYNFLTTVVHFLAFGKLPELDAQGRPKFAYGRLIHENCERRAHFDAGRFALEFGDEGHRKGYCLYKLGCKGPETYANCPVIGFNDVGESMWPVACGHPCFGCTEQGVGFNKPIHSLAKVSTYAPPAQFARVTEEKGTGATIAATAVVAGAVGAALGYGAKVSKKLGEAEGHNKPGKKGE
jgi:hydrogenase small subunit